MEVREFFVAFLGVEMGLLYRTTLIKGLFLIRVAMKGVLRVSREEIGYAREIFKYTLYI